MTRSPAIAVATNALPLPLTMCPLLVGTVGVVPTSPRRSCAHGDRRHCHRGIGRAPGTDFPCTIHRFTDGLANSFRAPDASRKGPTTPKPPSTVPKTALNTTPPTQITNTQLILDPMVSSECRLSFRMVCPKVSVGVYGP